MERTLLSSSDTLVDIFSINNNAGEKAAQEAILCKVNI